MTKAGTALVVDWAVAARTLGGESESGDLHVVAGFPGGALAAAIDGLGHGPEAAQAAAAAAAVLTRDAGAPVARLVDACHAELRKTRGVVMSLASFDRVSGTVAWVGVGDVEAVLLRADPARGSRESILLRGGVVGYQLPPLRAATLAVWPGDVMIFATDGVRRDFVAESVNDRDPQAIADDLLAAYAKGSDDALVLVVRYQGDCG